MPKLRLAFSQQAGYGVGANGQGIAGVNHMGGVQGVAGVNGQVRADEASNKHIMRLLYSSSG